MKNLYLFAIIILVNCSLTMAQEFDITLTSAEYGPKTHQARNSITFGPNYSFTPNGATMTADIVNPIVSGTISYSSFVDPMTRTLNTSYIVGNTNGKFDVNNLGAGTFTIPIDVPIGIGGLQPNLSINYNSMSGIGISGYGWNIAGLSAITRSSQTFYHDENTIGVDLTNTDRFSLDGQRLICISGTYGSNNSEYRTEIDNFTKIICLTDGTSSPKKFLAKTKGGLELQYGYEVNADQTIDGLSEVVSWYINKMTDLYGNQIDFEYIKLNGHNYIGEITYGVNTVTFFYKERTDKQISYFVGATLQQDLILDKIEIKYNSTVVKKYEFKYNINSSIYGTFTLLNEVIEYGLSNSRYNSTAFSYEYPTGDCNNYPSLHSNSYISTNYTQYKGDYNGDGHDDIFTVNNSNRKDWRLYHGTGSGFFTYKSSGSTTFEIDQVIPADLNGDGLQDLMLRCFVNRGYYAPYGVSDFYQFYYAISTENSIQTPIFFTKEYYPLSTLSGVKIENSILENSSTDFDGDGMDDMLVRTYDSWKVFGYSYNGTSLTFSQKISGSGGLPGDILKFGDFNGDGKIDLYTFDANGLKIYRMNGSSLTLIKSESIPKKDHLFQMGDFNSDGKTDIFIYGYSTNEWSEWQFCLSTGTSFSTNYFTKKKSDIKSDIVYTGDFNGDGRTDILALSKNTSGNPRQYYFVTKPNGTDMSSEYYERSEYNKDRAFTLGDYDGNGKTDILVTTSSSQYYRGLITGNTNILLSRIADGLNNTTSIFYRKLSDQYSNYVKGTSNDIFPVYKYMGPLSVVARFEINNGFTSSPDYLYKGLKIHRQGKGVLGFEQVVVDDSHLGIKTELNSGYDATYFFPTVLSTKNYVGGNIVSETKNTWGKDITKSTTELKSPIFPYIKSHVNRDILNGHKDSTHFTYDSLIKGSLKEAKQIFDNNVTKTIINNYFANDETNWYIGRVKEAFEKYEKPNELAISSKISYTYSSDGILKPDFVKFYEGTNLYYYKNHDYNSNGNLTQLYEYGNGVGSRQTNYSYETDGIRLKTVIDPQRHETEMIYDSYGRLYSEEDYLGNVTSYSYDNMGRISTQTQSDGFITTTTYNWGLIGGPASACYNVQQTGNDGSLTKIWYDKLARELRSDVKGFSGSYIYTITEYNTKNQVYRVSEPSLSTSPSLWSTNTWDNYGRLDYIDRTSGMDTDYSYEGNKVTETTGGKSRWRTTDSQGLITQVHDNGGDIFYSYFPDGKVKTINAGGVLTTMEYNDAARNQTKLIDPSAGTIEYTYNSYGQLKTQKNARSQTTTYNYHTDGRIDFMVTPEGTTSYSYNEKKQLVGISSPESIGRSFGYDTKGRTELISENIAGSSFSTSFTYDDKGRLKTRTHPSGIVETNNYNSYGYLASISAGGYTRYTITAMNARLQITEAKFGTSLIGDFGFNEHGYPTHTKASVSGTFRQDYRYSFNPVTGNMDSRQNFLYSKGESFIYDNLDRLKTVSGPENLSLNYHSNGNISEKSDVGNVFLYNHSTIPYALTDIETSTGLVSDVLQSFSEYTSFEQPSVISESPYQATFLYNSEEQRAKMVVMQNTSTILTRWYPGSRYMKETAGSLTKEYTWIGGDAYTAPVVAVKSGTTTNWYYALRDHLGTITHLVWSTNNVAGEYSFDAWGRRRDRNDWTYDLVGEPELFAGRGFTGHEWLPWFNLYNMNGRLYDPVVGRFLSPDNYVQMPDNTQNFNRYSYALNNPLKYTDPDGEIAVIPLVAFAVWGGFVNTASHMHNINSFGEGAGYFFTGAAASAAGAWAGSAVAGAIGTGGFLGGTASGFAGGFSGGFVGGAGNAWAGGADFGQGFSAGFSAGLTSGTIGGSIGGLVGGFGSMSQQGNFWDGNYRTGSALAGLEGGGKIYGPFSIQEVNVYGTARLGMGAVRSLSVFYGVPSSVDFSGFWGRTRYFLTGGNIDKFHYDWNGNLQGFAPMTGTAPAPGFAKGISGYEYVKKVGNFSKYLKVNKAINLPGQARAEYFKYFNSDGKMIRMYKDSYQIDGRFLHRRMLKPNEKFYKY